jgi:hypothetical protein
MTRIPTSWVTNPTKDTDTVQYSSASVLYSDAGTYYVSSTTGQNSQNKPNTSWTPATTVTTAWTPAINLPTAWTDET